jgi:membrane-bound lytic murein transglycosylase D
LEKQFDAVVINGRYSLESIAAILILDINQLRQDNPGMNKVLATGKSYELKLPKGMLEKFEARKNEILQASLNALYQLN